MPSFLCTYFELNYNFYFRSEKEKEKLTIESTAFQNENGSFQTRKLLFCFQNILVLNMF